MTTKTGDKGENGARTYRTHAQRKNWTGQGGRILADRVAPEAEAADAVDLDADPEIRIVTYISELSPAEKARRLR